MRRNARSRRAEAFAMRTFSLALAVVTVAALACAKRGGGGADAAATATDAVGPVPSFVIKSGKYVRLFELTRDPRPDAAKGALPIFGGAVAAKSEQASIYVVSLETLFPKLERNRI